jgi:hypothetical protein
VKSVGEIAQPTVDSVVIAIAGKAFQEEKRIALDGADIRQRLFWLIRVERAAPPTLASPVVTLQV